MHWQGDGGGGGAVPAITVTPAPAYSVPYFPHQVASTVSPVLDIDELMDQYIRANGTYASRSSYYRNLQYIKEHPPAKGPAKEWTEIDILNGILDVIGYGSALASFIPWAPAKIGGSIGYAASNAGRAFLNGNTQSGLRYLNQLSGRLDRISRQYGTNSPKMGASKQNRRMRR